MVSGIELISDGHVWAILEKLNFTIKGRVDYVDDPTFA
jgi:hypothetical protein